MFTNASLPNKKIVRTLRAGSLYKIVQAASFSGFVNACRRAQRRTFLSLDLFENETSASGENPNAT